MRGYRSRHTIRRRLFVSHAVLVIATLLVVGAFFGVYSSRELERRTEASLQSLSTSLLERIDQDIHAMDAISLSVAFAALQRSEAQNGISTNHRYSEPITKVLASILGPFQSVPEVYVRRSDGVTIGAGLFDGRFRTNGSGSYSIQQAEHNDGRMYISRPHGDIHIGDRIPVYKGELFVSLCRVYYDMFGKSLGVIEVEQSDHKLFANLSDGLVRSPLTDIVVYGQNGTVFYSTGLLTKTRLEAYYSNIAARKVKAAAPPASWFHRPARKNVFVYSHSDYSGLTVAAIEPESYVFAPVHTFLRILLTGGILAILISLAISYVVARWLTIPIRGLHRAIQELDGERLFTSEPQNVASDLDELQELNAAFRRMHLKLRDSVKDLIVLRSQEKLTQMLALQSQMRPHFLYNTLANISVMAEESMNDRIVQLCADLSAMYRYLGEGFSNLSTVQDEIDFTRKYLSCMSYRLDDSVNFAFTIPEAIKRIHIPKLTIQPLVENALKYGMVVGKGLDIDVSASMNGNSWSLTVSDDGKGFSSDALASVERQFERVRDEHQPGPNAYNGIGLTNIYSRLRILYGSSASFSVGTRAGGGTSITIGGLVTVRFGV